MKLLPWGVAILLASVSGRIDAAPPIPAEREAPYQDADPALVRGADLFKQISEVAGTGDQSQLASAISSINAQTPDILSALPAANRPEFKQLAAALEDALSNAHRKDIAIYSIETYQFLVVRMSPAH